MSQSYLPLCACGAETPTDIATRCRPCEADYMRNYRKTMREKLERRAYRRGIEDARVASIRTFERLGECQMNGTAAAEILKRICFT